MVKEEFKTVGNIVEGIYQEFSKMAIDCQLAVVELLLAAFVKQHAGTPIADVYKRALDDAKADPVKTAQIVMWAMKDEETA